MGWIRDNAHWVFLVCFLLSVFATLGFGLMAVVTGLSAVSAETVLFGGELALLLMLKEALPWVLATGFFGVLDVLFLIATFVAALSKVSVPDVSRPEVEMPKSDRLVRVAKRAEQRFPILENLDVSEKVEPGPEQRREELREKYVNGEITQAEFEERVTQYVDEEESDPLFDVDPDDYGTTEESSSDSGTDESASTDSGTADAADAESSDPVDLESVDADTEESSEKNTNLELE